MRARTLLLAIPLALILISVAAPMASAQSITVFDVGSYDKEITASEETSFEWVVYNNDTSVIIVQPSLSPSSIDKLDISISPAYQTITPQNSTTFIVTLVAQREMSNTDIEFTIFFNATLMNSPESQITITKDFDLTVKALYGTTAGNNKIFGIWDNPFPPPLDTTYGAFIITILGWIGIAFLVIMVVDPIVHRFTRRTETDLDDRILKMLRGPVFFIILLYGFTTSLKILNLPQDILLAIEDVYSVGFIILIIWLSYKVYDNILISYAHSYSSKTEMDLDDTLVPLMEKLGMIIIPFIGIMLVFNHFGYDLTVFLAGFGVLGIIIGFAAQDTLSNFFSGMSILLDRPFKVGDLVLYDDDVCEVRRIGMRSTTLYNTFKSENFIIPNNEMASRKITNIVRPDLRYKTKVEVGVAYGSDIELVKKLIIESALEESHVLKDPDHYPWIRFTEFADSALVFKLFLWVDDLNNQWLAASNIRENIDRRFKEHDINIPFPQRTVWLQNETDGN
jgi:MscS family membrane protein